MAKVETVEVNRDGTKVIVNKSDFDPSTDKLWGSEEKSESAPMSRNQYAVSRYEELYGKKPHHKMKMESIEAAIAEKEEE